MTIIAKIRYRHTRTCRAMQHSFARSLWTCHCNKTPRLELRCTETGAVWRRTVGATRATLILEAMPFLRSHGGSEEWLSDWLKDNYPPQESRTGFPFLASTVHLTAHKADGGWTLTAHGRYRDYEYWGALPLPGRYDTEEEATEAGQTMLAREALLEAAEAKRGNKEY